MYVFTNLMMILGISSYGGCLIENREFSMNISLLKFLLFIVSSIRFNFKVHLNVCVFISLYFSLNIIGHFLCEVLIYWLSYCFDAIIA